MKITENYSQIKHRTLMYCAAMGVSLTRGMNIHHLINLKNNRNFSYCDVVVRLNQKNMFNHKRRSLTMNIKK